MTKSNFEFFDNKPGQTRSPAITVDKHARIYLNKATRELMDVFGRTELFVGYDNANKRIGLAKPEVVKATDVRPVVFDGKRYYASAKKFLDYYGIPYNGTYRYNYVGLWNGIHMFQLENYDAPDDFKTNKDG